VLEINEQLLVQGPGRITGTVKHSEVDPIEFQRVHCNTWLLIEHLGE
jgi:hypothetical protein